MKTKKKEDPTFSIETSKLDFDVDADDDISNLKKKEQALVSKK